MTIIEQQISQGIEKCFREVLNLTLEASKIALQPTKKEFEGDYTFVTFPFLGATRQKPEALGELIGQYLVTHVPLVSGFNVVKGFLNLVVSQQVWPSLLLTIRDDAQFGVFPQKQQKVMVEYSSPNTNKPLHLGHLRNNFLGYSVAQILAAYGYQVMKVNLVNDRGIHICKSMLAYQQSEEKPVPGKGLKGDKLVGNFYVAFDKKLREETAPILEDVLKGRLNGREGQNAAQIQPLIEKYRTAVAEVEKHENEGDEAKAKEAQRKAEGLRAEIKQWVQNHAPVMEAARDMLKKWEGGDPETVQLWEMMNNWVYEGFNQTYQAIGVSFDKMYKESETYLLGKKVVEEGLAKGIFYRKPDGSVWIDLREDGLDEKLLLRADGTSVYITQDMGTADLKYQDFPMEQSVYVVGNEQDYHFKVLKLIMEKLGRPYAPGIYHLSYGMVDLPSGKMKSREGTVVDADDLLAKMVKTAGERTALLGKIDDFSEEEAGKLYHMLALGALKYYLLKVEPRKRMLFNPEESIDFQGNTGVYIQYTFAKISAIIRKAKADGIDFEQQRFPGIASLHPTETAIVQLLTEYPGKIAEAAQGYAPSLLANYAYDLAKLYSKFYAELSIFGEQNLELAAFRVLLSAQVARILQKAMGLLGVEMPERM
jgi:arginyl-tRNA synthetase